MHFIPWDGRGGRHAGVDLASACDIRYCTEDGRRRGCGQRGSSFFGVEEPAFHFALQAADNAAVASTSDKLSVHLMSECEVA